MEKLECTVWTNGTRGWEIKVLGGPKVRATHFRRDISPVIVEVDGLAQTFNIGKDSFWTKSCGELIGKPLQLWKERHNLRSGGRVHLVVLETFNRFRLEPSAAH